MMCNNLRINHTKTGKKTFSYMKLILLSLLFVLITICYSSVKVEAAEKKYGIMIADNKGKYTFYDFYNISENDNTIELTDEGNVMVPLERLVNLIPGLTYRYDKKKETATIINNQNGKKLIYKTDNQYATYYANAKASKKKLVYPTYISPSSSAVMVHMNSLKWLFNSTKGFGYYKTADMQKMGYDTLTYSGVLLYNPYQAVTELPKATSVNGISNTVKVTIPEGYSVPQVFNLLVKKGVCSSTKQLYDAMDNYDFSYYPLVAAIEENEHRCYKLEGYLYPDTYEFYRLSKAQDVIGKFLRNAENRITENDRKKAEAMGYSVNEILTIASIIEKETSDPAVMKQVSSVIYNRLNINMKLQMDCGTYYVERYIKPYITGDVNRYNEYYNMYKCKALPSGPICNPGRKAIEAAFSPSVTDYLYFYSDEKGEYHFSKEYHNVVAGNDSSKEE